MEDLYQLCKTLNLLFEKYSYLIIIYRPEVDFDNLVQIQRRQSV